MLTAKERELDVLFAPAFSSRYKSAFGSFFPSLEQGRAIPGYSGKPMIVVFGDFHSANPALSFPSSLDTLVRWSKPAGSVPVFRDMVIEADKVTVHTQCSVPTHWALTHFLLRVGVDDPVEFKRRHDSEISLLHTLTVGIEGENSTLAHAYTKVSTPEGYQTDEVAMNAPSSFLREMSHFLEHLELPRENIMVPGQKPLSSL